MDYIFEEVVVKPSDAPRYVLDGVEIDIWSEPYELYHSKSISEYVKEKILQYDREGVDPFPEIVGKAVEKEMVKNALLSGSSVLFVGKKGYGKTTFSKSLLKLLPEKLLAIKGCRIHDDPVKPACFSCKKKVMEDEVVELTWVPRKWIRVPGDPMMTTRQLIGGISIQKIKEGYELDHPEVFTPGRVLKANRGIAYFDELGSIPSALQTMLHELIEEKQITTPEGDIVPLRIDALFIASTNPANYRGTSDIKEPLMDRMEAVPIGPPESLEEEIQIGLKNMSLRHGAELPEWHLKIIARTVRYGRMKDKCRYAARIEVEPSCRATIKLFDHIRAAATRKGRKAVMLSDYGEKFEVVKLGLRSRMELDYEDGISKDEVIERLVEEAMNRTCGEIYSGILPDEFPPMMEEISEAGEISVYEDNPKEFPNIWKQVIILSKTPDQVESAFEIVLEAISRCTGLVERIGDGVYECKT